MSVPVRTASGPKRNAVELVKVRVMGQQDAVAVVAAFLRHGLYVAEESGNVARRNGQGVRRYLELLVVPGTGIRPTGEGMAPSAEEVP